MDGSKTSILPFFVLAQIATEPSFSWFQSLPQFGVCGLWILWFIIRDKLDREERKLERTDLERRHQENLAAQRAVENAFRTNTNSVILGMSALKHLNGAFEDMLDRVKSDNISR